jgi:hypothetical protein
METFIDIKLPEKVRVQQLKNAIMLDPRGTILKSDARTCIGETLGVVNGIMSDGTLGGHIEAKAIVELVEEGHGYKMSIPNPKGKGKPVTLFVKYK